MIKAEEIKQTVDFLLKEKQGCYFKQLGTDKYDRKWGIVIGWCAGFDEEEKSLTSDKKYRICTKIAYNNNALQCDYDVDFTMPYNEETDEVYDTDTELGTDFELEALRLNKEFEDVASLFGLCKEE